MVMKEDLVQWLLKNYGHEVMRPGLERMGQALKTLGELPSCKVITIAGTNGKGETSLRLSEYLVDKKFCTWTSPHIQRITERFTSEAGEIDLSVLQDLVLQCHDLKIKHSLELSYYEFLFFVFCRWIQIRNPEFLVLEVGLGGRYDAVNVFDADLVLLPSISRDHQEILGKRYDQILAEKLGVLRQKTLLIHFLDSMYLREKTMATVSKIGAQVRYLGEKSFLPSYEFSQRNQELARAAFLHFFPNEKSSLPLKNLEFRGEVVHGESDWLLFGSHNVDGVRKLIQFLHSGTYTFSRPPFDKVLLTFSKRDLRDTRVMLRMFKKGGLGKILLTCFEHPKAETKEALEGLAKEEGLEFVKNIKEEIINSSANERILVTGSYYFIGHIKSLLRE